ncbi:hypothetical protein CEXT_497581 [Caerostris extrusa]|uniref:Uncharacterized protein n=1 Tax=Caerostris extrusa TaxID=172846 RepID=A0AAV4QE38_CAEEX|nr:hypothetical protein CEXT_497581 [Caerostris extrusa]
MRRVYVFEGESSKNGEEYIEKWNLTMIPYSSRIPNSQDEISKTGGATQRRIKMWHKIWKMERQGQELTVKKKKRRPEPREGIKGQRRQLRS